MSQRGFVGADDYGHGHEGDRLAVDVTSPLTSKDCPRETSNVFDKGKLCISLSIFKPGLGGSFEDTNAAIGVSFALIQWEEIYSVKSA